MRAKRNDGGETVTNEIPEGDARSRRFESVFSRHRDDVWKYCTRRVHVDEVNDAVADVFVVVWRRLDDMPPADDGRLWIFGIARNTVRNRARSTRRRARLDGRLRSLPPAAAPSADDVAGRHAEHSELLNAVDHLSDDDRELLRLRTWEELSLADIATVTDLSVRAVESRLGRIRKKLARSLAETSEHLQRSPQRPPNTQPWSSPNRHEGGAR